MEIVYRIGADIGQRDQVERVLSSDLGSYPEVWCAWSDPGDDHAVIISYTGVIRQDLTVDPEDPRFQAFSVGFGTDFDAAEMQATTIDQRFSSQNDGSGYEVLLRETMEYCGGGPWRRSAAPEPNLPEGPNLHREKRPLRAAGRRSPTILDVTCGIPDRRMASAQTGAASARRVSPRGGEKSGGPGTMEVLLGADCFRAGSRTAPGPITTEGRDDNLVRSVGPWVNGELHGTWVLYYANGNQGGGPYVNGERHGIWTFFHEGRDDNVVREVGPYVNGEEHGIWTGYDASGNVVGTLRYENGKLVSGLDDPAVLSDSFRRRSE